MRIKSLTPAKINISHEHFQCEKYSDSIGFRYIKIYVRLGVADTMYRVPTKVIIEWCGKS